MKTLKTFVSITSKNSASDQEKVRKKCAMYGYCQTAWKPYAACKRKALCMCFVHALLHYRVSEAEGKIPKNVNFNSVQSITLTDGEILDRGRTEERD